MSNNGYILRFFKEEPVSTWKLVGIMAVSSGLANGALLGIINGGTAAAAESEAKFQYLVLFIIAMLIFAYAKRISMTASIRTIEDMLLRIRIRTMQKLRVSDLEGVERFGKGDFYTRISQDTMTISQSAFFLVNNMQSAIMVACCLFYIAWLSPWAFIVTVAAVALSLVVYWTHRKGMTQNMTDMSAKESELVDAASHILDGFKEIRVNTGKNNAVYERFHELAGQSKDLKVKTNDIFTFDIMFSQIFFYILIATIVFILPQFVATYSEVVIKTTAAILFVVGPLETIASTAPLVARSQAALKNLFDLEDSIDALPVETGTFNKESRFEGFTTITAEGLRYTYRDKQGNPLFTAGPLDLDFRRGEIIFFVGGNGCGKTTLMKLLTGLYRPETGTIKVDGERIEESAMQDYRELYAPVFADFHLFDRLYGLENVDPELVRSLLKEMELAGKTTFDQGRFTQLKLSTGQRKRLALVAALLEDREIYMFDEWAADQDPHFRKYYYDHILPDLKRRNKTVLVVSHDDRYWNTADRVVKLEYGRIERIETHRQGKPETGANA
ncbi:MAG: hypothetical protein A2498_06235 [Lentisphaerae bacterium RIFOXYC12_FULL_60_16]|nr:MAG: hypothetical protein A2498_06235 [Lentisphaerae bacterium RIFOXYC12_FULL_60_16]OGV74309.1 MAG: hypothetical protein A2269_01950 [Lentisphaerae bacterium RIFOXYA12_FULL_60_10]OGV84246.1 MAG: hypothetical protein A2340_15980 [Lentisphaerae bacterium RIFOXYB12_FULL_60_10]